MDILNRKRIKIFFKDKLQNAVHFSPEFAPLNTENFYEIVKPITFVRNS